jgi:HEAT repeat protein
MRRVFFIILGVLWLAPAASAQSGSFLGRKVSDWLSDLERGRKPSVRRSAAFALGRMGNYAAFAVPDLARRLRSDRDARVRDMAASALGDIVQSLSRAYKPSPQWETAGKALEEALSDPDPRVRRSAAYALGTFGELAGPAVPALKKALRDRVPSVRQNAAWALGQAGKAVDAAAVAELCDLLGDRSVLVRRDAASALERLGQNVGRATIQSAGKPLLELVKSESDEVVRRTALGALAQVAGPEHRDVAPELYPLMESKDADTANKAAYALGNMGGEPAQRALPVLRKALRDPDPRTQELAAATLANAGNEVTAKAVDDLARTLAVSKDPAVRRNCCVALGRTGAEGRSAIPALVEALKPVPGAPSTGERGIAFEEVREQAAEAIAQIRYPNNEAAIAAARDRIAHDKNPTVRHRCVWCLFNIRDLDRYDLVKTLTAVLDETAREMTDVRYDSARVLAFALHEKAPDKTCDVLLEMLNNKALVVFKKTDASIKGTGDEASRGGSGTSQDKGGDARYMAAEALGWLGAKAKNNEKVVAALRAAARDKEPRLSEAARKSLKDLGLEP